LIVAVPIVDCHTHVVAADHEKYPNFPATIGEFKEQMEAAEVAAALLVQPFGAYGTDNGYTAAAAASDPGRFGAVAVIDMAADDRVEALRYWAQERGMRGLRLFSIPTPASAWLDAPETFDVWRAADRLRVRLSVALLPAELAALGNALTAFPHHRVMLDHCGFASPEELEPLIVHRHLYLKVTTNVLDMAADPRDLVEGLVRRFGAGRLAWGSDFSQTHDRDYAELVDLAKQACARLSHQDQALFLGGTTLSLWPELAIS
jgi:predicted TIM-barrel fold metal-dependent hydrolase